MCTEFCQCPGTPADDYYQEYAEIPKETYDKFDRVFPTADADTAFDALDPSVQDKLMIFVPAGDKN